MGLLDDAIREHLDLKRRRGADPTEVARLEQEALGPVRREPAPAGDAADAHHEEHPEQHAGAAPEAHPDHGDHPAEDHTRVLDPAERHEPPHGDPLLDEATHADDADDDRAGGAGDVSSAAPPAETHPRRQDPLAATPEPGHEVPPAQDPRHSDIVHQPTTEFRVEDHHDDEPEATQAPAPATDDDVLEETPEFLQETPEHDRLWFEQRPPRDFDFDG